MTQDDTRLLTLLGPGGIGKTRLATRIGASIGPKFEHGFHFIALDSINDAEQIPFHLGQALQLIRSKNENWMEAVISFLQEKKVLLILDNLEQIERAEDYISILIDQCPSLKILATSRIVLGLAVETEYPLDSLGRPQIHLYPDLKNLEKFEAIQLFLHRTRQIQPNFKIDKNNAPCIVGICEELEGLPLPIELAAARTKLFSPGLILEQLKQNSQLLKSHSKHIIPRHQTIQQTIKWSYDLLSLEEQRIFQQLSLFSSGFTLDVIHALYPTKDSYELLESFINRSLIYTDQEVEGIARFKMLKILRDFGKTQVKLHPKSGTFYENFSNYFLQFLDTRALKNTKSQTSHKLNIIEAEYENLLSAIDYLLTSNLNKAAIIIQALWPFHQSRGLLSKGLELI
ncbi:MAG: NB-ARC domain-containing protein [Bacteroidota bacterium]